MDIAAVFQSANDVSDLSTQSDLRHAPVQLRTQGCFPLYYSIESGRLF